MPITLQRNVISDSEQSRKRWDAVLEVPDHILVFIAFVLILTISFLNFSRTPVTALGVVTSQ